MRILLALIITALLLSACGKKGPVRPLTRPAIEQPAPTPEENSDNPKKQSN